jgi:DNA adenine methylase
MTPILKYPGAKWRLAQWIIAKMPPHKSYLEPFFGSGAVFFNKPPTRIETINDLDGEVVNFFRVCRNHPNELSELLAFTPWSREERNAAFEPTNDNIERARRFAVRCWQTFGAGIRLSNGWRNSTAKHTAKGPDSAGLWSRLPQSVVLASRRLLTAQIENRPALEVIERNNGKNVLIYADPPYLFSTRNTSGAVYRNEMTDANHVELLNALINHTGAVLLSGYENDLYNDLLRGWYKTSISTIAELGAKRVECLWINPLAYEQTQTIKNQMQLGDVE